MTNIQIDIAFAIMIIAFFSLCTYASIKAHKELKIKRQQKIVEKEVFKAIVCKAISLMYSLDNVSLSDQQLLANIAKIELNRLYEINTIWSIEYAKLIEFTAKKHNFELKKDVK